jgi:sulfite reductase (ferredoxin)
LRFSLKQYCCSKYKRRNLAFYLECKLDFVTLGYDTINDITACPGTDTCNLGIASSTGIAEELERVLKLNSTKRNHY